MHLIKAAAGTIASILALAHPVYAKETLVFANGSDGYHTYRIPALITAANGDILAFAEARKSGGGDSGDIDLVLRRSSDGGKTWGALQVVWDDSANTCGNPCPVLDEKTGTLHLLLTWNSGTEHEGAIRAGKAPIGRRPYYSKSTDHGMTWAAPTDISAQADRPEWGWYATGPGRGIQLSRGPHAGRFVIPANHSRDGGTYDAHALISDDFGKTWSISASLGNGANESAVAELSDGAVLFNTRMQTHGRGFRAVSRSTDGGGKWTPLADDTALPCPRCEGSMLRWSFAGSAGGKSIILFCNPAGPGRSNITLRASLDEGATWAHSRLLYADKGPGYTALTRLAGETVGVLHETIGGVAVQRIPISELLGAK
jgi:sialidase-1